MIDRQRMRLRARMQADAKAAEPPSMRMTRGETEQLHAELRALKAEGVPSAKEAWRRLAEQYGHLSPTTVNRHWKRI